MLAERQKMFIDTHCHINLMIKKKFNRLLSQTELEQAQSIIDVAAAHDVKQIITVGTSITESLNCILIAQQYTHVFASVGLHPNDCTATWQKDFKEIIDLIKKKKENKIVALGECGFDFHYPHYSLQRQKDAFKAQIELALEYDLALIIHTRDAHDETLSMLEEFKGQIPRGIIHCFSEDQIFADLVIEWGFTLGIGGSITYPNSTQLQKIVTTTDLNRIILETDAPFLPPQIIRGKQNHPKYIPVIAEKIANLKNKPIEEVEQQTTVNAHTLFNID